MRGQVVGANIPANNLDGGEDERVRTTWIGKLMMRWWGRLLIAAVGWSALGVMFALPNLMTSAFK